MSDGAMCFYCRRYNCICEAESSPPQPVAAQEKKRPPIERECVKCAHQFKGSWQTPCPNCEVSPSPVATTGQETCGCHVNHGKVPCCPCKCHIVEKKRPYTMNSWSTGECYPKDAADEIYEELETELAVTRRALELAVKDVNDHLQENRAPGVLSAEDYLISARKEIGQ